MTFDCRNSSDSSVDAWYENCTRCVGTEDATAPFDSINPDSKKELVIAALNAPDKLGSTDSRKRVSKSSITGDTRVTRMTPASKVLKPLLEMEATTSMLAMSLTACATS